MNAKKVRGDYAWLVMAASIFAYDMFAIKTQKMETMSSAVWRSLSHPAKSPLTVITWAILTHHLFFNKKARGSFKSLLDYLMDT